MNEALGFVGGLPLIVPTCPRQFFAEGPRHKYVDIVTDTLHASSSDLITWNTLVMIKSGPVKQGRRDWFEIAVMSFHEWDKRDLLDLFRSDSQERVCLCQTCGNELVD